MRLMFSNCLRYNTSDSPIIEQVRKLRVCCIFAKLRLTLDCTLLLYSSSGRVHTVISEATLTHFPFLHSPMTVLQRRHAMRRLSLLILCFSLCVIFCVQEAFEYSYSRVPDEWHSQKLELPARHNHTSNHNHSRMQPMTPVSLRIAATPVGSASSSSSKHHSANGSHKRHKGSLAGSSRNHHSDSDSSKKCFKVRNSAESMIDLSLFPTPPSPSVRFPGGVVGGNHRIEQLEKHVATLTTALQHALSAGVGNGAGGALMNAILPLTPNSAPPVLNGGGGSAPSRGRPRKNGMPAQSRSSLNHGNYNNNNNNSNRKVNKKPSNKRKVRHLSSSSEEDDYDNPATGNASQPAFNPEDIEDLKKLKNDLENLRGKPLPAAWFYYFFDRVLLIY